MSRLPKAFKASTHEKMRDISAIPTDKYPLKITSSEYAPTASKNGHILKLQLTVIKGEYKGSIVFANLNLDNPSEQAVEIAERELATICEAVGKATIRDSKELMGKMLLAKVRCFKDDEDEDRNEIKMYWPIDEMANSEESGEEKEEEEEEEEGEEPAAGVTPADVVVLAKKYKGMTSLKQLKEVLAEYDITKTTEIDDMEEDDLESLKEDLEEAIEDEE